MRRATVIFFVFLTACGSNGGSNTENDDRSLQGGNTSSSDRTALAFENPSANLDGPDEERHLEGDANFGAVFVTPPAVVNAGLGPLFNNSSCENCHTKNGRGQPVFGTGPQGSQALLRLSTILGEPEAPGGPAAVDGFGTQLQDHAVFGQEPEGKVNLRWETEQGAYADGTAYELRKPIVSIVPKGGRQLPSDLFVSLRIPPPVFGLGLLEAVAESDLLALADPDDVNSDGISGRANYVWDIERGMQVFGRFGRKATRPTLKQQAAAAYIGDMGVTNPLFPAEDGSTEIDDQILNSVEFYVQSIAVPVAANITSPVVQKGETFFKEVGCVNCHVQSLRTGEHKEKSLRNQTIFPYTDMLLHNMGSGLADDRQDFEADGTEWRTPPLWGIGVTATILSTTANFLHDGRARSLEEAILWHGGEAEFAKEAFRQAAIEERQALIEFLKSL